MIESDILPVYFLILEVGTPISGILGDQQAALVGQGCLKEGMAKNTYGTGCFLLQNTGSQPITSQHGLLTTVAYKLGKDAPATFALEGNGSFFIKFCA